MVEKLNWMEFGKTYGDLLRSKFQNGELEMHECFSIVSAETVAIFEVALMSDKIPESQKLQLLMIKNETINHLNAIVERSGR